MSKTEVEDVRINGSI